MNRENIGYLFLVGVSVCYLIHTIKYCIIFQNSLIFQGKLKVFHMIMFWAIPFIWIMIIKALSQSTKGSYHYENKAERALEPWSDPYKEVG